MKLGRLGRKNGKEISPWLTRVIIHRFVVINPIFAGDGSHRPGGFEMPDHVQIVRQSEVSFQRNFVGPAFKDFDPTRMKQI